MRAIATLRLALAQTAAVALPATARTAPGQAAWVMRATAPGNGAWWRLEAGGRALELGCLDRSGLRLTLFGGAPPLPPAAQSASGPVPLSLAFGAASAQIVAAEWLGAFDTALIGRLPGDAATLGQIEAAERLAMRAPDGQALFKTAVSGGADLRFTFGESCGL